MQFLAPAKVNLSLRVLGQREDGFHALDSLMVRVSVFDTLEIESTDAGEISFSCDAADVPSDHSNLVVRAALLFCSQNNVAPGLRIHLQKVIPHGGGLGGGSSDAATTLMALNSMFHTGLSRDALSLLGAQIGSDVPFFLYQCAARISGRGEVVVPAASVQGLRILLVKPPFGVPTPWAYKRWRDSIELPGIQYGVQALERVELVNDLERPVFEKYLFLADLKQWLLQQPELEGALLSGSGATVFGVIRNGENLEALKLRLEREFGAELWVRECEVLD
jgi:4-diphosphocytidyl-2-C-methyl-D-erythritol kinase